MKTKEWKVSEQTARFIGCLETMQQLYSDVYSALELTYSNAGCEDIINAGFYEDYKKLQKRIEEFTMGSIIENMNQVGSTSI